MNYEFRDIFFHNEINDVILLKLYIKTTNSTGTGNQVTGATGQGSSSGAVVWDTTGIAAGTYHYNCQFHGAMHGLIVVT